jgi:DNA primase
LKLSKEIILTESIIDAFSCYVLGFRNVIPLYGVNGLTGDHITLFQKYLTRKIYLCLDNDQAGKEGRTRVKEKLSALGIDVLQIELPSEFKDINEALQKGFTAEQFRGLMVSRLASLPVSQLENEDEKTYPKINQQEDLILLDFGPRQYRIRGLIARNLGTMKVNLKVQSGNDYHLDSLDLYSAKARSIFISQCRKIFSAGEGELSQELSRIIGDLEKIQADSLDLKTPVKEKQMTPEQEQEALQSLKSPSLLSDILHDIETLGYVGESANKAIGYLVSVSRKLGEPLSCVIISQSSAGKSALAEFLEKLCPPEECLLYSRLTPQALYYMDKEALKRKLLIIEERTGAEAADYSIRTLQSRKKLTQAVPLKDPNTGKIRTMNFEVEGPIAYIETTTRPRINEENATRCFELYLDESKEQTKRIQQAQKEAKTLSGLNKTTARDQLILKQQNMQRLLKEVRVVNPYACLLEFPADWLRTRRDHLRFLNLIEAITFLYQYQREPKKTDQGQEYIESTLEDYRTAYDLAKEVLGESFTELKKPQRELLEKIEALLKEEHQEAVNRRQIREYSGLADHRLRELLQELVSLEYLEVKEGRQGKSFQYQLAARANALDKELMGLTTPEELARKFQQAKS